MLADFQQALADLTAMPDFCLEVRATPAVLRSRYALTDREAQRLYGIASHDGMSCACTVYRMNRLAPLAMNLPQTLRALGRDAKSVLSAYWRDHPRGHSHFFLESDRFCNWLRARLDSGVGESDALPAPLARERAAIRAAISASCATPPPGAVGDATPEGATASTASDPRHPRHRGDTLETGAED